MQTIRGRIIAIFIVCMISICALAALYWWSVETIRAKLHVSEQFEDLLNDILEARRYEKNFLFFKDYDSLNENIFYLNQVDTLTQQLAKDITRLFGRDAFAYFDASVKDYKNTMLAFTQPDTRVTPEEKGEEVRRLGKTVADFTNDLLMFKRKRIQDVLTVTLSRYISLASILATAAFPLWAGLLHHPPQTLVWAVLGSALIVAKHHQNIGRLIAGRENRFEFGRRAG